MTCRDCLYFKRCVVLGEELDMHHNKEAEKNCRHFKNKADFVEVVRCKDCVWFIPKHIRLPDGTTRPYTDEEKKLVSGVTADVGINVGSYCLRKQYWEQNGIPVWFEENDFCSYGERK